jgi:hypothetical protein
MDARQGEPGSIPVLATFRQRSYSADEQAALRAAIGERFNVQLQPRKLPEAGGTTELWLFLQSPEGWLAGAVLSGVAYDILKGLGGRLATWCRDFSSRHEIGMGPEVVSVTVQVRGIRFHLVDGRHDESPDVFFMGPHHLRLLPEILNEVFLRSPVEGLSAHGVTDVTVPVFPGSASPEPSWCIARFWSVRGTDESELLLDSLNGLLGPMPTRTLVEELDIGRKDALGTPSPE